MEGPKLTWAFSKINLLRFEIDAGDMGVRDTRVGARQRGDTDSVYRVGEAASGFLREGWEYFSESGVQVRWQRARADPSASISDLFAANMRMRTQVLARRPTQRVKC